MELRFDKHEETRLLCPQCGSNYLHQFKVETFARAEDSTEGVHVKVDHTDVMKLDNDMSSNPSSRRDGVAIHLKCEECPHISVLTIVQHKGATLIEIK